VGIREGIHPEVPASLGLWDMAGNVWQWCNDRHTCDLGTSPATDPTGSGSGPAEAARELKPRWAGWLKVDGKAVKIYAEDYTVLFARDRTGDLVDGVLAWGEDKESWKAFFEDLKEEVGYKLRGLTSDMREELIWGVKEVYGDVPHQYCAFHMSQIVDEKTRYKAFRTVLKKHGTVYNDLTHRILTCQYRGLTRSQLEARREQEAQRIRDWVDGHLLELKLRGWARRFLMASSKREAALHMAQIVLVKRRCRGRKKLRMSLSLMPSDSTSTHRTAGDCNEHHGEITASQTR
jgi:hypothetical protein